MKIKLGKRIKIRLFVRPPKWARARLFSGPTIWRIKTNEKKIFFTFDDGPIPEMTPWVLDTLHQYQAKATFFCVGENVEKHPELFQKIKAGGHGIGNHSYSHLNGFRTDIRSYVLNVFKARKVIDSNLFRPPYGRLRGWARRILKTRFRIILWDVLSMDYDSSIEPRVIVRNVIGHAEPGSILVFHDNIKAKRNLEYALPRLLDYYAKRGYEFANLQTELE